MPTDAHGVTHAGTLGLFDDIDENAAAALRAERHERETLETAIRRHERRAGRQRRRDAQTAEREAAGKSKLPWHLSWFARLFGGGKDSSPDSRHTGAVDGILADGSGKGKARKEDEYETSGFKVIRKPSTPEPVYTAEDVDPVDSPWLRECGVVRVKSDDGGGCHIVPKSSIQKSD